MTEENAPAAATNQEEDDDVEVDPEVYDVEAIRDERRDAKTGKYEFLVKWKNYPESQNTWEPQEHMSCPDIIQRFREAQKAKRKRSIPGSRQESQSVKRSKRGSGGGSKQEEEEEPPLILEDDSASTTETLSSTASNQDGSSSNNKPESPQPKAFERGLPIERIVGSCTDDEERLWFFIKWRGLNEIELVDANEIEEKAPKEMCTWYRERLYYTIKNPNSHHSDAQMCEAVTRHAIHTA